MRPNERCLCCGKDLFDPNGKPISCGCVWDYPQGSPPVRCSLHKLDKIEEFGRGRNVYSEEYVNELQDIGTKYLERCGELQRENAMLSNALSESARRGDGLAADRDLWREQAERVLEMAGQHQDELIECRRQLEQARDTAAIDVRIGYSFYRLAQTLLDALETLYGDAVLDGPAQMISAVAFSKARDALKETRAGMK